jgi:hypothetical protein
MQGIEVMEHIYAFGSGFIAALVNLIGKQFWQRCIRIVIIHGASAGQFNVAITEAAYGGFDFDRATLTSST